MSQNDLELMRKSIDRFVNMAEKRNAGTLAYLLGMALLEISDLQQNFEGEPVNENLPTRHAPQ